MGFLLLLPLLSVCLLSCSGTTSGATVVKVEEGSEAVLPCFINPKRDITGQYFNWRKVVQKDNEEVFEYNAGSHDNNGQDEQFKGRVSHFPEQLQSGDASIVIRDTKLSDRGNYTCDFPRLQPKAQMFNIELVVGACGEPLITTPVTHTDRVVLQCAVRGVFPKPKVEWQDSAGKPLPAGEPQITERGGSYDIILNTTVTKTDNFRCVVTQEKICHQVSEVTSVNVPGSSAGLAADVVVTFVVTLVGLLAKGCITQN